MAIDCTKLAVEELTELGLDKKRADGFVRNIEAFIAKHAADSDFKERLAAKIERVKQDVMHKRVVATLDATRLFDITRSVADFHIKPMKAADAIFETSSIAGKGSRNSIDNML